MIQIYWQKLLIKIFFWLVAEIILNLIGIDNLADYSEFIFAPKTMIQINHNFSN
ncbi:MAG: hypothetical protein Kow0049_30950 [Stanieria sp.]